MDSWMILAMCANAAWAGANLVDRKVVSGYKFLPGLCAFFFGLAGLLPLIIIAPLGGLTIPRPFVLFLALLAGCLYITAFTLYTTVLAEVETSRVVALFTALTPVFVLLFSTFLLGKTLRWQDYLAFFLLISGGIMIVRKGATNTNISFRLLYLLVIVSFLLSFYQLLVKYVSNQAGFPSAYVWVNVGSCLAALTLLFFSRYRTALITSLTKIQKISWWVFFGGRILSLIGVALNFWAISLIAFERVAFISALGGLQPLFVFSLEQILRIERPANYSVLSKKLVGLLLIGLGVATLNL